MKPVPKRGSGPYRTHVSLNRHARNGILYRQEVKGSLPLHLYRLKSSHKLYPTQICQRTMKLFTEIPLYRGIDMMHAKVKMLLLNAGENI